MIKLIAAEDPELKKAEVRKLRSDKRFLTDKIKAERKKREGETDGEKQADSNEKIRDLHEQQRDLQEKINEKESASTVKFVIVIVQTKNGRKELQWLRQTSTGIKPEVTFNLNEATRFPSEDAAKVYAKAKIKLPESKENGWFVAPAPESLIQYTKM